MSCDLELEITSGSAPGHYIITVDSPAGATTGQLRLDAERLLGRRRELASAVLASAVPTRGRLSAQELPIREVGQQLFEAVFAERVYGRYTASLQEAARRGEPLRLVLRLRTPELAALPWETMFDADRPASHSAAGQSAAARPWSRLGSPRSAQARRGGRATSADRRDR